MRQHLPRWIHASCRVFFEARRGPFYLFYEGLSSEDRKDVNGHDLQHFAEFRIDGPTINTRGKWLLIEINILCLAHIDHKDGNILDRLLGTFTNAFENDIPVYKYGNDPIADDRSFIGCLSLLTDIEPSIRVTRFGQPSADIKMLQASVEAEYRMREPS